MTSGPPVRFRLTLCLAAFVPLLVAGLVAVTPLGDGAAVGVLVTGGVGTAGAALVVWLITRRFAALTAECRRIVDGAPPANLPANRNDELGVVAAALEALNGRRQEVEGDYRRTLTELTDALEKVAEGAPAVPTAGGACGEEVGAVTAAVQEAAKKVATVRQRLALATKMLHGLPAAVVAVDESGAVRFLNPAAERVFGRSLSVCARKPLVSLLGEPDAEPDPLARSVLRPSAVGPWLTTGAVGEAVVEVPRANARPARVALTTTPALTGDGLRYLVARDLSDERVRVAADRARVREEALRAVWAATAAAGTEPVDAILASARLLAADAKQSTGRDALLLRVAAVRHHAGTLEAHIRTVRWLTRALRGELPAPVAAEFRAGEPARAAIDQLTPQLKGRNLTVTVSDDGGWVCGDDEWIRTALLGILGHAAEAAQDATIGLRMRRLPAAAGAPEERVCYEVVDAGPPLTADQKADLERPFGGLEAPGFLATAAAPGFVPGLLLAAALARQAGGALEFDTTPGGGLVVRFVVPTRLPVAVAAVSAPEVIDAGPVEELVMGWRLGGA